MASDVHIYMSDHMHVYALMHVHAHIQKKKTEKGRGGKTATVDTHSGF